MAITNARILIRRGNEVDFDAYNMQPGEWALSTDEKIVRICVAPGVCIRMATYEAFEADMAQIQAILEEAQTIEEAVQRVSAEVSENAVLVEEYTAEAKKYRDEAEQFRNEAQTFSPDGYAELVQNVEENTVKIDTIIEKAELNIKNSAKGNNLHLTDSASSKVVEFGLYGKATQDGEPTPDNPVEINVSGASGSVEVTTSNEENTKSTTATISTPNGLAGIKVNSDGNYTDENGQQRVCDEIVKYADGTGQYVQRIGFLDGNSPWLFSLQKNIAFIRPDDIGFGYTNLKNNADLNYTNRLNLKCTHLVASELGSSIANGCFGVHDYFYIKNESLQDANAYKEWMKANDFKMTYFLPTPIITDLSAEEIAEIEKLQTFYPVTNISNDADCGMSITYLCDAKNYIDNRLALIESAMLNNI